LLEGDLADTNTAAALQHAIQSFRLVDGSSARLHTNEIPEIAGFNRQRVGLPGFDQHAVSRPQKRQLCAYFIQADAKTVRGEVQKRKLLRLDERSHGIERFEKELHFQMKSFHEPASAPLRPQEEVRPALLHLVPVIER